MTGETDNMPTATLKPRRRISAAWIVTALAVAAAVWLAAQAWRDRGVGVTVHLTDGEGLKAGDAVRYRGIPVGEVRTIVFDERTNGVRVTAALHGEARRLARAGSRFWVVRPQLGLSRVAGLETLIGPRYLAVLPGSGAPQHSFIGLPEAPVVERQEPGDLEIILTAPKKGSLRRGAPVIFRQVTVGAVLSVGLTSDGGAVEARVHIDKAYAELVRQNTRFWDAGGVEATVGLTGLTIEVQSIEALLAGAVALATPPEAGAVVHTGHRFDLAGEPPENWLTWQPLVVIGSRLLPPGAPLPTPLRATVGWTQGRWISRQKSRHGWVLQTADGLLGPSDLLRPDEAAEQETAEVEVAGRVLSLEAAGARDEGGLALLDAQVSNTAWPEHRHRRPDGPEDCLAVADPTSAALPLAAGRLADGDHGWAVDPAVSVDESWHGAAVVARSDGYLLGLLLVVDGEARVALVPRSWLSGQRN